MIHTSRNLSHFTDTPSLTRSLAPTKNWFLFELQNQSADFPCQIIRLTLWGFHFVDAWTQKRYKYFKSSASTRQMRNFKFKHIFFPLPHDLTLKFMLSVCYSFFFFICSVTRVNREIQISSFGSPHRTVSDRADVSEEKKRVISQRGKTTDIYYCW